MHKYASIAEMHCSAWPGCIAFWCNFLLRVHVMHNISRLWFITEGPTDHEDENPEHHLSTAC